jgi:hypothetical protein
MGFQEMRFIMGMVAVVLLMVVDMVEVMVQMVLL